MGLREGKHRLSIDIHNEMWEIMVKIAEKKNISMSQWIRQLVFTEIIKEQKYD